MQFNPPDENYELRVRRFFAKQPFMNLIGARLEKVAPGYCEIYLDYAEELSQHDNFFHGGVIGTMADNAGGFAAMTMVPADSSVLTVEYKVNIVSPGVGERMVACGQVLKAGRTLLISRSEIFVETKGDRKLCAVSLMTLMRVPAIADNGKA